MLDGELGLMIHEIETEQMFYSEKTPRVASIIRFKTTLKNFSYRACTLHTKFDISITSEEFMGFR